MRNSYIRRSPQPGSTHQGRLQNSSSVEDYTESLSVAQDLIKAGIPVFVAKPATNADGSWDPGGGHNGCGCWFRRGGSEPNPILVCSKAMSPVVHWEWSAATRSTAWTRTPVTEATSPVLLLQPAAPCPGFTAWPTPRRVEPTNWCRLSVSAHAITSALESISRPARLRAPGTGSCHCSHQKALQAGRHRRPIPVGGTPGSASPGRGWPRRPQR